MGEANFLFLLSLLVIVPVSVGLVRLRKISSSYQPFLIYLCISLLNECVTFLFIKLYNNSAIPTNIFMLLECNTLLFQFYYWRFRTSRKRFFFFLMAACTSVWIFENIFLWKIAGFNTYFRFIYSFILVLLAVNEINYSIVRENQNLLKNAKFLICLGFIIYFLYQILYEGSYTVHEMLKSQAKDGKGTNIQAQKINFTTIVITSFAYIAAVIKILYAIAILFIPAKRNFPWKKINTIN